MAKSLRSKREKRLRAIRREMVEPLYDQKEVAKQAAMDAALAAPKIPQKTVKAEETLAIADAAATSAAASLSAGMDVDMEDADQKKRGGGDLKPMGKKMKKKVKIAKRKSCKGKLRKRHV